MLQKFMPSILAQPVFVFGVFGGRDCSGAIAVCDKACHGSPIDSSEIMASSRINFYA